MEICRITAAATRQLRQQVLRPTQRSEDQVYPNDDAPDALHAGAFRDGKLVGIATVFRDAPPGEMNPRAWRLRGMAVLPAMQGQGVGRALVELCVAHIRARRRRSLVVQRTYFGARVLRIGGLLCDRRGIRRADQWRAFCVSACI